MMCPNCRCHVPSTADYCAYCGYEFDDGDSVTLPVTPRRQTRRVSGNRRFYHDDYYYRYRGLSQELSGCYGGYAPQQPYRQPLYQPPYQQYRQPGYGESQDTTDAIMTALLVVMCGVFALIILMLLLLIL